MNVIKLSNSHYEVKVENGKRMVRADRWMEATVFVDWLIANNKTQEISDLVRLGINTIKGQNKL
jgi:hypothetical protein